MTNDPRSVLADFFRALAALPEETPRPRISRGRVFVEVLAEHDLHLSVREANAFISRRVDSIASHTGMTRAHIYRRYVDEQWVRNFAAGVVRTLLDLEAELAGSAAAVSTAERPGAAFRYDEGA